MLVNALFAAKPKPFGPRGAPSSIEKQAVSLLTVSKYGTLEDEQGNKKLHGGPEKVLHQYGPNGYKRLSKAYPQLANRFIPGTIGENISCETMHDGNVQVGDIYRMGEVVLQVSAPRAPCNKISQRYGEKNLDRFVGKEGITGWYYRVIQEGLLRTNDEVGHLERPPHSVSISNLVKALFTEAPNLDELSNYADMTALDDEWREKCQRRLSKFSQNM